MNEKPDHPPDDTHIDQQLAARIVALVLGEASDFERDELNRLIAQNAKLAAFAKEIQSLHGLMLDVALGEPLGHGASAGDGEAQGGLWKLSDDKRDKILDVIRGEGHGSAAEGLQAERTGQNNGDAFPPPVSRLLDKPIFPARQILWNFSKIAAVLLAGGFLYSMAMPSSRYVTDSVAMNGAGKQGQRQAEVSAESLHGGTQLSFATDRDEFMEPHDSPAIDPSRKAKSTLWDFRESTGNSVASNGPALPTPYYLQDDVQYFPPSNDLPPPAEGTARGSSSVRSRYERGYAAGSSGEGDSGNVMPAKESQQRQAQDNEQGVNMLSTSPGRRVPKVGQPQASPMKSSRQLSLSETEPAAVDQSGLVPGDSATVNGGVGLGFRAAEKWEDASSRSSGAAMATDGEERVAIPRFLAPKPTSGPGIAATAPEDKEFYLGWMFEVPDLIRAEIDERGDSDVYADSGEVLGDSALDPQSKRQSIDRKWFRRRASGAERDDVAAQPFNKQLAEQDEFEIHSDDRVDGKDLGGKQRDNEQGNSRLLGVYAIKSGAQTPDPASDEPAPLNSSEYEVGDLHTRKGKNADAEVRFREPGSDAPLESRMTDGLTKPARERQLSLEDQRKQMAEELYKAKRTLRIAEQIVEQGKDPEVALNVMQQALGRKFTGSDMSNDATEKVLSADEVLGTLDVDKQLLPLMIERNRYAEAFGAAHPSVKKLESELKAMEHVLEKSLDDQAGRPVTSMQRQGVADSKKTQASEAVASVLYAAKKRASLLKSQLNEVDLQIEAENVRAAKRFESGLNEKTAQRESFSTFSLHVSDVSFKLAQAALGQGEWPEAAKIRIEEFVNAFDYGDPMPRDGEPVACRVEQCIHPFMQQRNLMRVALRTAAAGRAGSTPLRLTLLLDNSGSMERIDRQQTVRRAFALLAQQLKPMDQITLISFARQPRLLADKVSGDKAQRLVQLIKNLPSEGGTNIEAALQLAFEKAREQQGENAQNRIVLLTDGAVNLGNANPESLSRMVTKMRGLGIAFDAAGIGADGLNDEVLEALTRKGDGRYYLLDSVADADAGFVRQIAGALRPSAKNVKVQIEFNPKRVGRYKLLGFEKHRLEKKDFRNDKVDAAEMAAAEAGVAVYQFEALPGGEGEIGSLFVRFQDLSTGRMVEHCWPIPYESDAQRIDQASASLKIATSAAMLAAKLRGEPLGETVDLKTLFGLVSGLSEQDRNAKRVQQLLQMIQQARQASGK